MDKPGLIVGDFFQNRRPRLRVFRRHVRFVSVVQITDIAREPKENEAWLYVGYGASYGPSNAVSFPLNTVLVVKESPCRD